MLGTWGEGYVTSLASARRVLSRLAQQGVPMNVDVLLNGGYVGKAQRVQGVPWRPLMRINEGDCLRTAHISRSDIPRALQAPPAEVCAQSFIRCREYVQTRRRRYCGTVPTDGAAVATREATRRTGSRWHLNVSGLPPRPRALGEPERTHRRPLLGAAG